MAHNSETSGNHFMMFTIPLELLIRLGAYPLLAWKLDLAFLALQSSRQAAVKEKKEST